MKEDCCKFLTNQMHLYLRSSKDTASCGAEMLQSAAAQLRIAAELALKVLPDSEPAIEKLRFSAASYWNDYGVVLRLVRRVSE